MNEYEIRLRILELIRRPDLAPEAQIESAKKFEQYVLTSAPSERPVGQSAGKPKGPEQK